jgi:hypothetical protein
MPRKRGGQWVITLNHVSAREVPGADRNEKAESKRKP